jgi:hypothetical protein
LSAVYYDVDLETVWNRYDTVLTSDAGVSFDLLKRSVFIKSSATEAPWNPRAQQLTGGA